jgi:hypothetical protein
MMQVRPLHPKFGAEIAGVLIRTLDEAGRDRLRAALDQYGLLLFRDQALDDKGLQRFSQLMGTGKLEASARSISHGTRLREVANLTTLRDADGTPIGFGGNTTDYWHSDAGHALLPDAVAGRRRHEFRNNPRRPNRRRSRSARQASAALVDAAPGGQSRQCPPCRGGPPSGHAQPGDRRRVDLC